MFWYFLLKQWESGQKAQFSKYEEPKFWCQKRPKLEYLTAETQNKMY